jgi:hypothetical protein
VWNFKDHGEGEAVVEPPIFGKEKKATFIKNQDRERDRNNGESNLMIETTKERAESLPN